MAAISIKPKGYNSGKHSLLKAFEDSSSHITIDPEESAVVVAVSHTLKTPPQVAKTNAAARTEHIRKSMSTSRM